MKEIRHKEGINVIGCLVKAQDNRDAIIQLGQHLVQNDFVETGFIEATLNREEKFPTGLPTAGLQIALPHTEGDYVKKAAIVVGVLQEPVMFGEMGNADSHLSVKIVCLLAIKEPGGQIETLQTLATIFENSEILEQIAQAADGNAVETLFVKALEKTYA